MAALKVWASLKKGSIIFTEESGNKSNKAVFTEPSAGNGILKNAEAVKAFGNTGKLSDRSTHKKIKAGKRATFVLPVRSWAKCSRPYEYAFSRARWITEKDVETLHERAPGMVEKVLECFPKFPWMIR